jgi:hypothetical protein
MSTTARASSFEVGAFVRRGGEGGGGAGSLQLLAIKTLEIEIYRF